MFALEAGEEQLALVRESTEYRIWTLAGIAFDVIVLAGVLIYRKRRSVKKKKAVS